MSGKPQSIDRTLSRAKTHARKGDLAEAEALYRDVLARFPQNQRALNGLREITSEMLDHKRSALKRRARPTAEAPDPARAACIRGQQLLTDGDAARAEAAYAEAIAADPACAEAHGGRSAALRQLGRNAEAADCARQAILLKPALPMAHVNLGCALLALDQPQDALTAFAAAMTLNPDYAETYVNTAEALMMLGKHDEALSSYHIALKLSPEAAEIHNKLGAALYAMGRHAEALEALEAARSRAPEASAVQNNIGAVLGAMGDRKTAAGHFAQAIALRPDYAEAHFNLCNHRKHEAEDPHLDEMRRLLARRDLPALDRIFLDFGLGKALEDAGLWEESFARYQEGNSLRKRESGYSLRTDLALFARIRAAFPEAGPPAIPERPDDGPRPVFVLGMPRSGTSLVEQILASHSSVHGAGELEFMARAAGRALGLAGASLDGPVTAEQLCLVRDEYRVELAKLGITRPVVVDKMPLNFRFVGFIAAAMPEARIIHIERDPVATCWSIFKHRFTSRGNGYAYDLEDLGRYFRLYRELMAFWHQRFPGRILDVNYEHLTENQEADSFRMISHAGLDWEEACLAFHQTPRAVMTASAAQVRRKMYRGSSEAWHNYEPWLGPLKAALAD